MTTTALYTDEQQQPAPQRASSSSFYLAMRLLPRRKREAMFEIYSFCRAVDDVADGDAPRGDRHRRLAQWRSDIDALYAGRPKLALRPLASAVAEFALRKEDFFAIIDGMEMDAAEDIRAPDWATLDLYCDRVASAVGRLSVRVFGLDETPGLELAHHLGRALQLTNILRDIDEDAAIGRLYLPREALEAAGIASREPDAVVRDTRLAAVCGDVAARARKHFAAAQEIMARSPAAPVRAPKIMGEVYRAILDGMVARGWLLPRERVRVPRPRILWIVLRAFL